MKYWINRPWQEEQFMRKTLEKRKSRNELNTKYFHSFHFIRFFVLSVFQWYLLLPLQPPPLLLLLLLWVNDDLHTHLAYWVRFKWYIAPPFFFVSFYFSTVCCLLSSAALWLFIVYRLTCFFHFHTLLFRCVLFCWSFAFSAFFISFRPFFTQIIRKDQQTLH